MKVCSFCKIPKQESEFHKKVSSHDGLRDRCKDCAKVYIRKHYRDNKQYYFNKSKEHRKLVKSRISELKEVSCMDCGFKFPPECMDFDHARGRKKFDISIGWRYSEETLLKEIKKCDIICANCHRIRTKKRLNRPVPRKDRGAVS